MLSQSRGRWIESSYGAAGEHLEYRLFVPGSYDGRARMPLVVMLHGCTQSAEDFARGTRMQDLAERSGFLVVFPEQRSDAHPQRCWNWYDPAHQSRGAGEPALIAGMTRQIVGGYAVDPDRVYIAGISAGGAMSVNVAVAYPELFAAIGVHSGIGFAAARSMHEALRVMREGPQGSGQGVEALLGSLGSHSRLIPLFAVHGAADPVVNVVNTDALVAQWALVMSRLAGASGPPRIHQQHGEAGGRAFTRMSLRLGPDEPTVVEQWTIQGLGHAWSGGNPGGSYTDAAGPDVSREMVRFFLREDRPRDEP